MQTRRAFAHVRPQAQAHARTAALRNALLAVGRTSRQAAVAGLTPFATDLDGARRDGLPVAAHRGIAAFALRGGASVVGGVMTYILFQVVQRMEWNQKRRIKSVLAVPPVELVSFRPGPLFLPRTEKNDFLTEALSSDPGSPMLITGPQGSGKTMILKRALARRPNTMYLSLRATPVASGEGLSVALVTSMGFLLPPNELLGRAIFNREAGAVPPAEIDRALRIITDVLREEKAWGWINRLPDGRRVVLPPVLCIDELNHSEVGNGLLEDPQFWRIVDWAMHLSDNRLAHVVFCGSLDVADLMDRYPGFRVRRQKVHFDFPRAASVRDYYHRILNPFLQDVLGATPRPVPLAAGIPVGSTHASEPPAPEPSTATEPAPVGDGAASGPRASWWRRLLGGGSTHDHSRTAHDDRNAQHARAPTAAADPGTAASQHDAVGLHDSVTATSAPSSSPKSADASAAANAAPQQAAPAPTKEAAMKDHGVDPVAVAPPAPADGASISTASDGDTGFPIAAAKAAAQKAAAAAVAASPPSPGRSASPERPPSPKPAKERANGDGAPPSPADHAGTHTAAPALTQTPVPSPAKAALAPAHDGAIFLLEPWEIDRLIEVIGGHLKDIDTVVAAITSGTHWSMTVERLVADSAELVERSLDDILASELRKEASPAAATAKGKAMARVLRARATVAEHPLPAWNFGLEPTQDRLASYARYLRAWCLIFELANRKYISKRGLVERVFAECPTELDFFVDAGLIISINVKATTKLQHQRGNLTFEPAAPGIYVTASSPRMRVAFRALTADARLQQQTKRVQAALRAANARLREQRLLNRINELSNERNFYASQVSMLYLRDTSIRTAGVKELMGSTPAAVLPAPPSAAGTVTGEQPAAATQVSATTAAVVSAPATVMNSEDVSPLGMKKLAAALAEAQDALKRYDDDIANRRKKLQAVRAVRREAEAECAVLLPNTDAVTPTDARTASTTPEQTERDKAVNAMFDGDGASRSQPEASDAYAYSASVADERAQDPPRATAASPFAYGVSRDDGTRTPPARGSTAGQSPWATPYTPPSFPTSGFRWWL